MKKALLTHDFFARSAQIVAPQLLGKYLIRRVNGKTTAYKIVETEAYVGPHDTASHAHRGRTARNEPMWGSAGHWYVYFTYGMHYMLNVVTGKDGYPSAVLIRGVETISGPGRLTRALKIDKRLNTKVAGKTSGLWIEDRGERILPREMRRTPRIGVDYAKEWSRKPLRYIVAFHDRKGRKSNTVL